MRLILRVAAVAVCAGAFLPQAAAEVLYLKNGNRLEGQILRQDEQGLTIDIPEVGQMDFVAAEVDRIEAAGGAKVFQQLVVFKHGETLFGSVEKGEGVVRIDIPGTGVMEFPEDTIERIVELSPERASALEQEYRERAQANLDAEPPPGPMGYFSENDYSYAVEEARMIAEMTAQQAQMRQAVEQAQALASRGKIGSLLAASSEHTGMKISKEEAAILDTVYGVINWMGGWLYLIAIIGGVFCAVSLQTLAQKTDTDMEWMAWLPVLHLYLATQVARKPWWWVLVYAFPFTYFIADVVVWRSIARERGKSPALGFLALIPLANLLMIGYLAFGE